MSWISAHKTALVFVALSVAALVALGWIGDRVTSLRVQQQANTERIARLSEQRQLARRLHFDTCVLANINRKAIRFTLKVRYADGVRFLRDHPDGIAGLFTKEDALRSLKQQRKQYEAIWPVDCAGFVQHPELPPKLIPIAPLTAS